MEKEATSLGVALGIIIFVATTFISLKIERNASLFMIVFILIVGFVTVFWWRKSLTQRYIEKIRLNEIENLESELAKLKTENEALAKIIHKDNKLIPAMEMSVREVLANPSKDLSTSILEELEKLSSERKGIILTCENNDNNLPSTGFIRIDSLIKYMYQKCIANGIQFDFRFDCDMSHMLGKVINEDSFTTLIADLIENAIIATREQPVKKILFYISYEDNLYKLSFFDSGIHFDRSVILNLGKNKITTHAETGGSGIGLMSTMDIVRRHKGTFRINTELNDDTYTKQVLVTFSYVS
ncbi:MAG: GHKL domain-containing protein [Lachnospiraceae bacterium]|nr:GHKL domain-containing protein [Lachnospiraceae bacterium]